MDEVENIEQHNSQMTNKNYINKSRNCLEKLFPHLHKKEPDEIKEDKEKLLELLKPVRYKPISVEQMAKETKFSVSEVKFLYRAFKQECPTGISSEETFKEIYKKIFPLGDSGKYAHLVFIAIDRSKTGGITFGDFMEFLSLLTRGSTLDRILWSFEFYDVNRDGVISRDEMMKVSINYIMWLACIRNVDIKNTIRRYFGWVMILQ